MSIKDKDVKTLDKLKQFFRINKGVPGSARSKEDFSLSIELERDLSPTSPLNLRIKTIKDLIETVQNNKLEENAPAKFWCLLEDLLSKDVSCEYRHLVFTFFQALIHGQYERLGMMRAQFYKIIRNHQIQDDIVPRLELFQSLTDNGKDILYMEDTVGMFLLQWMPEIIRIGRELDFLTILITCIKHNASYFDEDVIFGIVQNTCILCCQSKEEQVVVLCLQVLDTIVCYASLPSESLPPFVATLSKTVNIELYCQPSWKIIRNLLGTHLGHATINTMCDILLSEASQSDPGLLRGAVFYISMALWGNKRIVNVVFTPSSVLDAFLAALKCGHTLVMYEVMLGIQLLVNKQGHLLLDPTWSIVLEIIKGISIHLDKNGSSLWNNQVSSHLHDTLNKIESLVDENKFNGQLQKLFDIIERCSCTRPEASVERLIDFIAQSITPARSRWLEKLDSLMLRFYDQDEHLAIRKKVLGILAKCIKCYRHMFESELTKIVVEHLGDISNEPHLSIRTAATQILVELFIQCEPPRALQAAHLLDKVLNRPFAKGERLATEEEAEDVKLAAEGLVKGLTTWMYKSPPTPALRAYHMMNEHLDRHYAQRSLLLHAPSIRQIMLDCLLKIRCDASGKMGYGSGKKFSIFLSVQSDYPMDLANHPIDTEHSLNISRAMTVILSSLRIETDWNVMLSVLQGLPQILKSPALFSPAEVDKIATSLCDLVAVTPANLPEGLTNTPPKFTKSDFHCQVFQVVTSLIPYHGKMDSGLQQMLIKTFESGLAIRSARHCVFALTLCVLEMQDAMVKMLPEVLLNLSKISATVVIALPILEFLSTLTQLPKVFSNFVGDQYMSVFAISLPYTNPFKYNHYTVSLAHHVIASWFLKCRLPFRRDFVKFIINGLKSNLLIWNEELVNEDSSSRKRSSSLTEQGSRKRESRPPVSRLELKPPMDENLVAFHRELAETCSDLMAMYTFSTCSPVPKRNNTTQKILNGGQSMTWLVGNKLVTVTTSGCTLKAVKHGFCDRCFQECCVKPDIPPDETKEDADQNGTSDGQFPSTSTVPDNDQTDLGASSGKPKVYRQERQVCACWCKAWAEILVKRAAGSVSWTMRLSNELHPLQCPKDFTNSEISTFLLSPLKIKEEHQVSLRKDSFASETVQTRFERAPPKMGPIAINKVSSEMAAAKSDRVASEPVSIPYSPIRKNANPDFEDIDEGPWRSRNPVKRSNSSPEMSSNWKNPLLSPEPEVDFSETKKKQNYSKEMRGNWEAIPEEIGTTPPMSEALMLAPIDHTDQKPTKSMREGDPSGLPPLGFKRDRGHTISVMSPARKSERGNWADPRSFRETVKPQANTNNRSGVNPAFAFLQLYHSPYFGASNEKPYLVPNNPGGHSLIRSLDWIPPYEVHKVGVLYVGPGQTEEADILRNEYGSPRYISFLERLGTLINLTEADPQHYYLGGLDTSGSDGKFSYIWQDDVMQVIFHVATLMPSITSDPLGNSKKKNIGNNYVTIVYNDSGDDYNFNTVKAQFNFAVVVVEPLDVGTSQVLVKSREDLRQHIPHADYLVVSDESAPILARQLAIHADLASTILRKQNTEAQKAEPYASNWLERLRQIKRIRAKLQLEQAPEDRGPSHRRLLIDDFTEYT